MARIYLFIGLVTLAMFSWGQYSGIGLFDEATSTQPTRLSPSAHSTFHK